MVLKSKAFAMEHAEQAELQQLSDEQLVERLKHLQTQINQHMAEYNRRIGESSDVESRK